jgi:hypothetical protein
VVSPRAEAWCVYSSHASAALQPLSLRCGVSLLAAVTKFKVGDRVGFGPQRNSCHACEMCHTQREEACLDFEGLYDPKKGGYATSITVRCGASGRVALLTAVRPNRSETFQVLQSLSLLFSILGSDRSTRPSPSRSPTRSRRRSRARCCAPVG